MSLSTGRIGTPPTAPPAAAVSKFSGNLAGKGLGVAASLVALWLMRESFNGAKDEWVEHYRHFEDETNMDLWRDRRGNYSGQPTMDNWAIKLREFLAYGIAGTRMTYKKWKIYTEGFINNVLLPNLFPLGIAAGGAYIGLGENGRQAIAARVRNAQFPILRSFGQVLAMGAKGMGQAIGSLFGAFSRFTAKNPIGSFALLGLGLFGAHRFQQVYNGEEQDDFFRELISPPTGGH